MLGIEGKVAVVTGSGRGIGRAYALGLAREGAEIVVTDVLAAEGEATRDLIVADGGKATFVTCDVSDEASTQALARHAVEHHGGADILVNNAAFFGGLSFQHLTEISVELWDKVYAVNVRGVWLCTKAIAPIMKERGGGVIINQSSIGVYTAPAMFSHYTSTKAAVSSLTKSFARELADWNIRVNAIAPGVIQTQASKDMGDQAGLDAVVGLQMIKKPGAEDLLVGPLLFLASDASTFMTGQVIVADGGRVLLG